ncbi:tRNA (N6-isopentenyl adenosine(37)-C2)-methylthiotransferase MiaB [Sphingobacteriales bacterium UPWRP_1]|nr:tRNA (N6-isopentenyl adenosine(37)-C2)-methylthiotransferase MiaB [Sphingobacteriales bacterium TSM_CSS]PSJ77276.1 tRNA (N6-isopentenyl adenosine(37)-C2)-methylthiotransferase MiaB [Sphingobacteriales bacterium UPWRP_1]
MQQHTHTDINLSELINKPLEESRQGEALAELPLETATIVNGRHFYIESYGCQMNFNDSEIVASILATEGYSLTNNYENADLILLNTCSIREKAEERVRSRLKTLTQMKRKKPQTLIGILGCMAERLKKSLLEQEQIVDIVIGPDSYRSLPALIAEAEGGQKAVNVLLSREETYADVNPVRLDSNGVSAFVSIMRGCDNMCSFCVVPFTRGRERSRSAYSIVAEAQNLFDRGYREVTLLGQNVDSYKWQHPETEQTTTFAQLLEMVAQISPLLRVRFSTSHPKDMTNDVLHTMAKYRNICKYIHLPVQSGSSRVLQQMNRTYDRQWYIGRIEAIRQILPGCGISTDIIAGFCTETDDDHAETLSMMEYVHYDMAYMFAYSERPGTLAARRYPDDVPDEIKNRRLQQIIALQNQHSLLRNQADVGKVFTVLVEKNSKRSDKDLCGRTDQNKMVVFPRGQYQPGDYVEVLIESCTSASLKGKALGYTYP